MDRTDVPFGPWSPNIDPAERRVQLRCLSGLVYVYCGMICDPRQCMEALRLAENGQAGDLAIARVEFDRLPPLVIRKIISVFGRVTWPPKHDIKNACETTGPRQKTTA